MSWIRVSETPEAWDCLDINSRVLATIRPALGGQVSARVNLSDHAVIAQHKPNIGEAKRWAEGHIAAHRRGA